MPRQTDTFIGHTQNLGLGANVGTMQMEAMVTPMGDGELSEPGPVLAFPTLILMSQEEEKMMIRRLAMLPSCPGRFMAPIS